LSSEIALRAEDLPGLATAIDTLERDHAEEFRSGFILESPSKLRRLLAYYRAVCGLDDFPPVRCNAPEFSAVIETDGALRPCFFIPGPGGTGSTDRPTDLAGALNTPAMKRLRADIRAQGRAECLRCVCAKWRDPAAAGTWD
jgi:MoaA/NifB/PqqE/SkfB family radical SAM enzyme